MREPRDPRRSAGDGYPVKNLQSYPQAEKHHSRNADDGDEDAFQDAVKALLTTRLRAWRERL